MRALQTQHLVVAAVDRYLPRESRDNNPIR